MPSLSLVMIVRNEERCLAACLASAAGIADEIVIGDTGSADRTKEIAAQFGANVIDVPWLHDFSTARNTVLSAATGDWLLHLDADEELDPQAAAEIRALVDSDGDGADAVELVLLNYSDEPRAWRWEAAPANDPFARGKPGFLPVPLLRLFRNRRGFHYRDAVHENITPSVLETGGVISMSRIRVHHHGFSHDATRGGEKGERYLSLARKKAAANPGSAKAHADLAEQALACGHVEEARAAAKLALALWPGHLGAGSTLANLLLNRGALNEAQDVLLSLEKHGHHAPHISVALAAIALREGHLTQAASRLNAVLQLYPRNVMARLYLARLYDQQGETAKAQEQLKLAHDLAPTLAETAARLEAHTLRVKAGELASNEMLEQALETLVEALRRDPDDPLLYNDMGVILYHLGEQDAARENLERALRLAPALAEAQENLKLCDPK